LVHRDYLTQAPLDIPLYYDWFNGVFSGPVRIPKLFNGKDKLFFMANYEAYRKRGSTTALFSLASPQIQAGNFSGASAKIFDPASRVITTDASGNPRAVSATPFPGNIVPAARFDPLIVQKIE
jgi:hypothetical protein